MALTPVVPNGIINLCHNLAKESKRKMYLWLRGETWHWSDDHPKDVRDHTAHFTQLREVHPNGHVIHHNGQRIDRRIRQLDRMKKDRRWGGFMFGN